jgi:hypothetical protein
VNLFNSFVAENLRGERFLHKADSIYIGPPRITPKTGTCTAQLHVTQGGHA